jgi:hypothetical protein
MCFEAFKRPQTNLRAPELADGCSDETEMPAPCEPYLCFSNLCREFDGAPALRLSSLHSEALP